MKTKTIPFNLEMVKKIQLGEIKGKIKTRDGGHEMKIICFNSTAEYNGEIQPIIAQETNYAGRIWSYFEDGSFIGSAEHEADLVLEVPDNEPQEQQFNPFDKVIVRDSDLIWTPKIISREGIIEGANKVKCYITTDGGKYIAPLPYEGNEHLVGTTDKPKELC